MNKMDIGDVIKRHVLRFVPAKSLCRFRAVCKNWDRWITSPFLAHEQANYFRRISGFFGQTPDEDPTFISLDQSAYGIPMPSLRNATVRSSCNGLLCCQSRFGDTDSYFICNPVNNKWVQLPFSTRYHGPESAIALVCEPSPLNFEAHFELVCAIPDGFFVSFEIYSSRTNSWRVAESEYYSEPESDGLRFRGDGFYMNGFVYWETSNGVVLVFDLKAEQYGELHLPQGHGPPGVLTEMNGELCYIMPRENENEQERSLEIYGEHSMELKRRIPIDDLRGFSGELRALPCVDDNVLVILLGNRVIAYHVRQREAELVKEVVGPAPADHRSGRYLPYVNSLVSVCPVNEMPREDVVGSIEASHLM